MTEDQRSNGSAIEEFYASGKRRREVAMTGGLFLVTAAIAAPVWIDEPSGWSLTLVVTNALGAALHAFMSRRLARAPLLRFRSGELEYADGWWRRRRVPLVALEWKLLPDLLGQGPVLHCRDLIGGRRRTGVALAHLLPEDAERLLRTVGLAPHPTGAPATSKANARLLRLAKASLYLPLLGPVAWALAARELRRGRYGERDPIALQAKRLGQLSTATLAMLIGTFLWVLWRVGLL